MVELVKEHDITFAPSKNCARRLLHRLGEAQLKRLLKIRECDNRAHTKLALASFEMKLPPQQFENGKTQKAVLSVQAAGKISTWGSRKYPIAKLKAVLVVGEQRKECAYPFECDSIGTSLMDDQQIVALLNYIRYV